MTLSKALRDPVHRLTTIPIMALNEGTGLSFYCQYLSLSLFPYDFHHYQLSSWTESACKPAQQMIYNKIFVYNFRSSPLITYWMYTIVGFRQGLPCD